MKGVIPAVFLALLLGPAGRDCKAETVNGRIESRGGQKVLVVWGSHYEMGYAQGYLLHTEVMDVLKSYLADKFDAATYGMIMTVFGGLVEIPQRYQDEMKGMLDGVKAAGESLYIDKFSKEIDLQDIALANAYVDLSETPFGCSSISAWGEATSADPGLGGGLVLTRDMDWTTDNALLRNAAIVAYHPSASDERDFVSIGFTGLLGCLSCMNRDGVGLTLNVGNHSVKLSEMDTSKKLVPILLALREGVERKDHDGNGSAGVSDVVHAVKGYARTGSWIVHAFGKADAVGGPALVLECTNKSCATRTAKDDPELPGNVLAATNHHRTLFPPTNCWRYAKIREMVKAASGKMDLAGWWSVADAVEQGITMQTMQFVPGAGRFRVSFTSGGVKSPDKQPVEYTLDSLFSGLPAGWESGKGGGCEAGRIADGWSVAAFLALAAGIAIARRWVPVR